MSLSSFCVVMNALRLNLVKLDGKRISQHAATPRVVGAPVETKSDKGESRDMTKTMTIDGMMCPHCSGRVKRCLESLDAVTAAEVSHESGKAILTLSAEIDNDVLKKTVEDQGYTVLGIE